MLTERHITKDRFCLSLVVSEEDVTGVRGSSGKGQGFQKRGRSFLCGDAMDLGMDRCSFLWSSGRGENRKGILNQRILPKLSALLRFLSPLPKAKGCSGVPNKTQDERDQLLNGDL